MGGRGGVGVSQESVTSRGLSISSVPEKRELQGSQGGRGRVPGDFSDSQLVWLG